MDREMIALLEDRRAELESLCQEYGVRQLDVFGSAALGTEFKETASDLDFLVEFHRSDVMGPADQYFGLLDALTRCFQRPVDLLTAGSLRNPYLIQSINATRRTLYAS